VDKVARPDQQFIQPGFGLIEGEGVVQVKGGVGKRFVSEGELKEQALAKTEPFKGRHGRYHPADELLAFLQSL
jgi:hypothetical protein